MDPVTKSTKPATATRAFTFAATIAAAKTAVHAAKPFTINAGPNNPVGTMWIGLSENGYMSRA
jgi:lipoprotein-anchoring transpeptidase ErfK/SrfK